MTSLNLTAVDGKTFGAVVTGVRLPQLDDATFARIHAGLLEFGFLVFPDQHLSVEDNVAFGRRFGELEFGGLPMANQRRNDDGSFGEVAGLDSRQMRMNVGNEAWHTDSSYRPISSRCAMLSAVTVPATGGETALADARAGYAALDEDTRAQIEHLSAYHSNEYSQANDLGDFPPRDPESIYHGEAYLRPLVKVHPETGQKALFMGRHAFGIPGLSRDDSRALLRSLVEFIASDSARVYTHRWQAGDTLIWDNRCILHRALPYDYSQPRVLIGTRIAGDPATELAYWPTDPEAQAGRTALDAELNALRSEAAGKMYGEGSNASVPVIHTNRPVQPTRASSA